MGIGAAQQAPMEGGRRTVERDGRVRVKSAPALRSGGASSSRKATGTVDLHRPKPSKVDPTSHVLPAKRAGHIVRVMPPREAIDSVPRIQAGVVRMNLRTRFCGIAVALLLVLLPGIPATGQTDRLETGNQRDISRRSTTGAGAHDETTAASRDGKADGQGNPRLGGKRRPLYRLTPGDVSPTQF